MNPTVAVVLGQKRPASAISGAVPPPPPAKLAANNTINNSRDVNPIRALLNQKLPNHPQKTYSSVVSHPAPVRASIAVHNSVIPPPVTVTVTKPNPFFQKPTMQRPASSSSAHTNTTTPLYRGQSAPNVTIANRAVNPASSSSVAGPSLLDAGEDAWDESDYLLYLHRDMHRVYQIHNAKVGTQLSLEELKMAKKTIDRERAEYFAKQKAAPAKPQNSILAKLASEKKTVLGGGAGNNPSNLNNSIISNNKPVPAAAAPAASYAGGFNPVNKIVGFTPGTLPNHPAMRTQTKPGSITTFHKKEEVVPNLLQAMPAKNGEHYLLVGETLLDMKALQRNANQAAMARQAQAKETVEYKIQAKQKESQFLSEIDQLLAKQSSHAAEADAEKDEILKRNLQILEKREFIQQKASEITCLKVNAFQCMTCQGLVTDLYPDLCKEQQHAIKAIKANKRFFKCKNCGKRDSTLINIEQDVLKYHRPPNRACHCGSSSWMQCGLKDAPLSVGALDKDSSAHRGTTLTGEKLIASASEWTSAADKLNMAVRVSRLN